MESLLVNKEQLDKLKFKRKLMYGNMYCIEHNCLKIEMGIYSSTYICVKCTGNYCHIHKTAYTSGYICGSCMKESAKRAKFKRIYTDPIRRLFK